MAETEYCPHGFEAQECTECMDQAASLFEDGLAAVRIACDDLNNLVDSVLADYKDATIGALLPGALLDGIEMQRTKLSAMEKQLANRIRFNLGSNPVAMPSGRLMLLRASKARRGWDHERARAAYMTAVYNQMVAESNGEVPEPEVFAARVLEGAQVGAWKVGKFKAVDLSVDDFCEFDYGDFKPAFGGDSE